MKSLNSIDVIECQMPSEKKQIKGKKETQGKWKTEKRGKA